MSVVETDHQLRISALNKVWGHQDHWYGIRSGNGPLTKRIQGKLSKGKVRKKNRRTAQHVFYECEASDYKRQAIYYN